MVLPWWKKWCRHHLNAYETPWWMVSFSTWTLIPSLLFRASLDPHQKANAEANTRLVYPSLGLCMFPFVLNTNLWSILYFLLEFTCLLTIKRSHVSNSLMILPLKRRSLCLRLLSYTSMLNNSLCINISGDAASKWYKACFTSKVPSFNLDGDSSKGNGNTLRIATTDQAM